MELKYKISPLVACIILTACFQYTFACTFLEEDSIYFKKATYLQKKTAFLLENPQYGKQSFILDKFIVQAAGPFSIKNVVSTNSSSQYNHTLQGSDWPAAFSACAGQRQSPIDIITQGMEKGNFSKMIFCSYNRIHPNMKIINNGHSVDILQPWGLTGQDIPIMAGGPLKSTYRLYGIHFHWGYGPQNGSEHLINSVPGSLEMHLVHYDTKFPNITAALASGESESLAVVGFIFKTTPITSPRAKPIFDTLRKAVLGQIVYPAFFPLDIVNMMTSYFTYLGSLTTPTCDESVRWIVAEVPILTISRNDLRVFSEFQKDGVPIVGNYRNVVPLNGRQVFRGFA